MAKPATDDARKVALRLIAGLREGQGLSDQSAALRGLPVSVQARAMRLAATTLRHRGRADAVLEGFMSRRPPAPVQDVLQLATVEMLELGGAAHGVVDAAVNLTRGLGRKGQAAAGMVNAVLRKVAGYEGWAALPPQHLPDWLRGPVVQAYGETAVRAIEAAHQAGAPLDLTLRPGAAPQIEGAVALPTGSLRLAAQGQVSALPGFEDGQWWVQDAAAALAVRALDPQPGERIADLCAAPGGKTLQLAAAGAQVTAVDISKSRLARLRENLARTGLKAELVASDVLAWQPESAPDAVLLDAPCSATGTIRRHPDLPFLRDGSGIAELIALQARLLDHALMLLKPGGRLVYATCSLLPDEGEEQILDALARHPGLAVETAELQGVEAGWVSPGGGLRLRPDYWPERGGMDGFYIARLRKGR
ncbi:16S rRNA (cytosine967-C5)-methyltransferase [Paracoccus alcaliphilus]|uniref:16S rRNA (Cytosine967-C5)-methyltransferase n=1 Tax=Paracoccus alcaliphilus TaxID=34002 RepID=A0A1H8GKW7_9RHOB|nr:transcription antitermination factor NusB [Paracoccus alcaliphilus]WCR18875.1 methyltransferase domain-containing protein [Paracoccus alcaliphilus]SEN44613.1 16S rRNA (cytosine967-C5)-methyltransferase [Paracoccus alcaliphilus]